eukprot:CAMPEP_0185590058 /NCGR_PEP_ID=MMETSP0434-20130131/59349_1 /TAXON_ID=626734 ORGANISM="Favella taraikaensis, Strain Fe Narragansett Bay" /NCGR_SAMPLE_ID=MMETSP0434 /ASSEMBLY_ACC=CAM_ASM_000379 /LENGTH=77 /DNA_ID=CAMNT_0028213933 /DNA_START=231 /DNA_END=464 /DNA_ORIENTATION=-
MIFLFPILVFFALNEPHDCYECLGKDPDRIYSSFQMTFEERALWQVRAKFNSKQEKEVTSNQQLWTNIMKESEVRGR